MPPSLKNDKPVDTLRTQADKCHRQFADENMLMPMPSEQAAREHTFRSHADSRCTGRIDDVLVNQAMLEMAQTQRVLDCSDDSDHSPLLGTFDLR